MRPMSNPAPPNLAIRRRFANRLATLVVPAALGMLAAAPVAAQERPIGPEPAASAGDVEALKTEIKKAREEAADEAQRQAREIVRLRADLERERQERALKGAATEAASDETRKAVERSQVVRAGRFGLSLTGFIQADAVLWRQSSVDEVSPAGDPLNENRFMVRRARLRVEADYRIVSGAIEFDGNTVRGYQARLIGAEASVKWPSPRVGLPYLQLTIGSFKTPFGYEVIQSDRDRLFLERSNAERALFPGEYDVGIRLSGGWRFLRYAVAAMNGDPIGEKAFPGRDPNESKDIMGRLGVDLHAGHAIGLAGGFSALWGTGFHKGAPATKDALVWRDTNENGVVDAGELQSLTGQQAVPSQNFTRYAIGGDLRLTIAVPRLGELLVYGEIYWASNLDRALQPSDPVATGRDLRQLGWYAGATLELTKWAQLGVRYDQYNPDADANDVRNGVQVIKDPSWSTLAATAAFRWPGYGRVIAEYDRNQNALGRTVEGLPTTLADDAFILRGQVDF
jgi:hypothetical protein